jgi:hypothetical protein
LSLNVGTTLVDLREVNELKHYKKGAQEFWIDKKRV